MSLNIQEKRDSENNREYAYRLLRDHIMTLQLLPGTTLNEGELSELLKVSRTPVHEAILMLKEESLVEVYPQSGSKVSLIDINIMKEGYFLRLILEPEIIRQISGNMSAHNLERLKEKLDMQSEVLGGQGQIDHFFKLDDRFHHLIYEAAGKHRIWYAMKQVSSHYDRVRYLDAILNHTDLGQILQEHKDIYHILLIGLPVESDLKKFYDGHLGTYRKHFQEILEKFPEYFVI